jgi:hypothetical protein
MQLSYDYTMARAFAGMIADNRRANSPTFLANEAVGFGLGLFRKYGAERYARKAVENQCVITDSAGTYTAGSIVVTVNGTAITQTYDTDKNTALTALAAAIAAGVSVVSSCAYSSSNHTITIQTRNTSLTVSVNITGITGTMTISSVTNTSLDSATNFVGVTVHDHAREQAADGTVQAEANEALAIMQEGTIYVQCEETVTADDPVYVRVMADGAKLVGMFGKTSTAGQTVALTNCRFNMGGTTTNPAKLVINHP